jgi:hypothetical protein
MTISLTQAAELVAEATEHNSGIDVVIYGSTVHEGLLVGDLDVWLGGNADHALSCERDLLMLAHRIGITLDVVLDLSCQPLTDAVRWCVHQDGLVITGERPRSPPGMTEARAEAAYRSAVVEQARECARRAEILALAGSPPRAYSRKRHSALAHAVQLSTDTRSVCFDGFLLAECSRESRTAIRS